MNMTIFSGLGSAYNVVDQITTTVPEYLSYTILFAVAISIPVVMVPALLAILIIVKNKELQTNNNIFLINLLLADMGFVVVLWCTYGLLTLLYLLDVKVDPDCRIIMIPNLTLVIASKLMFLPTCVERFIHIAFPFSYKRIVTTKAIIITIITPWMVAIVVATLVYVKTPMEFIQSTGICQPKRTCTPLSLALLGCFIMPFVLITLTSIYLRQRIIKSNNFFHSVKRNAAQEGKSNKAGRLAEILQEQVKPTLAVFRVGGIDAILDILFAIIVVVLGFLYPSNTIVYIVTAQIVAVPIRYTQSANHTLVYNSNIREKIFDYINVRNKHSKVIILHRE